MTDEIKSDQLAVVTGDGRQTEPGRFTLLLGEDAAAAEAVEQFDVERAERE